LIDLGSEGIPHQIEDYGVGLIAPQTPRQLNVPAWEYHSANPLDSMSFRLILSSSNNLNYSLLQNDLIFSIRASSQQNVIITRFLPLFGKTLRFFRGYSGCERVVRLSGILSMVGFLWAKLILTQLNPLNIRKTLYNLWFSSHSPCLVGCMYFF
jgi:hypothetical protein